MPTTQCYSTHCRYRWGRAGCCLENCQKAGNPEEKALCSSGACGWSGARASPQRMQDRQEEEDRLKWEEVAGWQERSWGQLESFHPRGQDTSGPWQAHPTPFHPTVGCDCPPPAGRQQSQPGIICLHYTISTSSVTSGQKTHQYSPVAWQPQPLPPLPPPSPPPPHLSLSASSQGMCW